MKLSIPNSEDIELSTVILDLNGTITVRGVLIHGVVQRLVELQKKGLHIVLFSGDTLGNAKKIADELSIDLVVTASGMEKKLAAAKLNPDTCVAIGNGRIDVSLFETVKLAIAVLQGEGLHTACLQEADIVVVSILDALDLLIDERCLVATLRG